MDKRQFIKSCALTAALLPLAGCSSVMAAPAGGNNKRLLPLALNKGDTVALVSPSKATDEALDLQIAQEVMQAAMIHLGSLMIATMGALA